MKILLSSYHNPHFRTITEYLENAIRALGHELYIFDDRQHVIPGRVRKRISFLNKLDLSHINKRLIALALGKKPDLAIIAGGHRISSTTVNILKSNDIHTVLWTIDAPIDFQPILDAAPYYDNIFCQGTEAIELLAVEGIQSAHWLPVACDPEIHRPRHLPDREKNSYGHDVVFVGSFYPTRAQLFEKITHPDFAIYGPGWQHLNSASPLEKKIRSANTKPEEWIKIYNSSKIILAPHYQDISNRFLVNQASPRIFEALACGSFVITDRQKDVLSLLDDRKHLITFDNSEDLNTKIQYYLLHSDQREQIARQGYKEVRNNHTFIHRVSQMLSIIHESPRHITR